MRSTPFWGTRTAATLASIGSAIAGLYLLTTEAAAENSLIEVLAHGIGIYFLAKAFYVGPALNQAVRHTMLLERIAGIDAQRDREVRERAS